MKLTIIESPYAGHTTEHTTYARRCLADSLARGEAPYASHLLYTQPGVLDDTIPAERRHGIEAGFAWGAEADLVAVYTDYGVSIGMSAGVTRARNAGQQIEYRSIGKNPPDGPSPMTTLIV